MKKKRRIDLPLILVIAVSFLLIAANIILGIVLVDQSKRSLKSMLESRMLDVANVAADMLNGDDLARLKRKDRNTEIFDRVNNTLIVFQNNIELKYIYTVKDSGDNRFTFLIDPSEDSGNFGEEVTYTDALKEASLGTPSVDKEPYTDRWGRFYSAYSPVYNSAGKVAGIVAVDFDADWYDAVIAGEIRSITIGVLFSLVLCLVLFFTVYFYTRKKLKNINDELDTAIEKRSSISVEINKALNAEYFAAFYVDLDKDDAECVKSSNVLGDTTIGDHIPYHQNIIRYADFIVHPDYKEEFLRIAQPNFIRERLKNDPIISFIYLIKNNEEEKYVKISFSRVLRPGDDDTGIVRAASLTITDVDSETRFHFRRNKELKDALEKAEQANDAKTNLLLGLSHEIRTPINEIIKTGRKLLGRMDFPDDLRSDIDDAKDAAYRIEEIMDDVLDLSSIEAGHIRLKNENFSFSNLLEHIRITMDDQCRKKGVIFDFDVTATPEGNYIGDPDRLFQCLATLISNSIRYTPPGLKVTFEVMEMSRRNGIAMMQFIISDSGVGLSSGILSRIFEPYSQDSSVFFNENGSSGLGMPLTKELIQLMGGTIDVKGGEDSHTTFIVNIPFYET